MAVAVEIASHGPHAKLKVEFTNRECFGSRPGVDGIVSTQISGHSDTTSAGLNQVFAVSDALFSRVKRAPNLPFLISKVFKAPWKAMLKFDVRKTRSVHQYACFWLEDDAFHDDASAVMFEATPLHPRLRAETLVMNGDAQREGVPW